MTDTKKPAPTPPVQPQKQESVGERIKRQGGKILPEDPEAWRKAAEEAKKLDDGHDDWERSLIEKSRKPDGTLPGEAEQERIKEQYRGWVKGADADKKKPKGPTR